MFGLNIRVIRVFGIDIKIDASWAIIATFIAWALAQGVFPELYEGLSQSAYWWMALAAIIGLGVSIILHELAHSLVAKALGLPLKSITLFIFGGVAELEAEPKKPAAEFAMAIAGPLMSVVLALVFGRLGATAGNIAAFTPLASVFQYLSMINWVLAIFNMLPALPLDGGRVFRALAWRVTGDLKKATRMAAKLGVTIASVIMGLGLIWMLMGQFAAGLWWILIGLFIRSAASSAVYQGMMQRLFRGATVREYMGRHPIAVTPDISIRALVEDFIYEHHFDLFPVIRDGKLVGAVGLKEAKTAPRNRWGATTVSDVMTPVSADNTVEADEDAMAALMKMHKTKASRLIVVDHGRLAGVIVLKDLLDLLSLKMTLEGD